MTATLIPLPFTRANLVDAAILVAVSLIFFASLVVSKNKMIARWKGAILVGLYVAYLAYTIYVYV